MSISVSSGSFGGTVSTKTALTASAPTSVSVTATSALAVAANASRTGLILINTSSNRTISIGIGTTAIINSGITLGPGGVWTMDEYTFSQAAINAVATATANLAVQEFTT